MVASKGRQVKGVSYRFVTDMSKHEIESVVAGMNDDGARGEGCVHSFKTSLNVPSLDTVSIPFTLVRSLLCELSSARTIVAPPDERAYFYSFTEF